MYEHFLEKKNVENYSLRTPIKKAGAQKGASQNSHCF
jgi:hypothetical protein